MTTATLTENLHDKWAASEWHQLWADDNRAFVLMPNGGNYLVVADDRTDVTAVELAFSEAMDEWNRQINEYLENCDHSHKTAFYTDDLVSMYYVCDKCGSRIREEA